MMLSTVKAWIYGAVFAVLAFLSIVIYRKGRSDVIGTQTKDKLDAIRDRQDVQREIQTQDDDRLVDLISRRD